MPHPSQNAPSAELRFEDGVPEQAIAQALSHLALESDAARASARAELKTIAESYLVGGLPSLSGRTAAAEKKAIGKAARHLEKALFELERLAPEYAIAVDVVAAGLDDSARSVIADVERAFLATAKFVDMFKPVDGRTPDLPLREAVQAMFDLAEDLKIEPPTIRMNKPTELKPEFSSSTALALAVLLQGVNPKLTEITLINMIEHVRRHPDKDDNLWRLISLHPVLDLSLRPSRAGPQARRDFSWHEWEEARERAGERTRKPTENG